MKKNDRNFFWPSYADLMTSLFFVMLVLYVLTFLKLKYEQRATQIQLNKIKEIQNSVKELPEEYFSYQEAFKRFAIKEQIQFGLGESKIPDNKKQVLTSIGKSIENLIRNLKSKYPDDDIRYLLIIEGMASKDNYTQNYQLSYLRALELYRLWQERNIKFDEKICEVQIAGSGTGGVGRFIGGQEAEARNQRFLIQIIPKIGKIDN